MDKRSGTSTRREFLKRTAAAGLALGAGPAIVVPGKAQPRTLRILKWKNFVRGFDRWFTDTFVAQWSLQNDTTVTIDSVGLGEISARAAQEASNQNGHDMVLLVTPATTFQNAVIDHRELFEESVSKYGKPLDVAYRSCYDPRTRKHTGLCTGIIPALVTYRGDLWNGIGSTPDTWDDVRRGGRQIRLLHDRPVGISLATEHNSEHSLRAIMYSFGSYIQDTNGNPTLKSKQTLEAIKFVKALYEEAMSADVLNWNAVSNNQYMLAGNGSLTVDTLSIVRASESKQMPVADNLRLAQLPGGPAGHIGPSFGIDNFVIWQFSPNVESAKKFLIDLIGASRDSTLASGFQHMPSYPAAVEDLHQLMESDNNAAVSGQYALLKDVDQWITNVGYPGFANPAISEILNSNLISKMCGAAISGALSPQDAMVQADEEIRRVFARWH